MGPIIGIILYGLIETLYGKEVSDFLKFLFIAIVGISIFQGIREGLKEDQDH